ncbi:MAG: hypothetical protein RLZ39_1657 [Bacteroidota bacterium]|jgi:hypothetical protein
MELQKTNPSYELINKDSMLQLSNELSKLIKEKGLSSNIQGKQFVNVEGWQFAGASLGLMPIITNTQDLSNETTIKYMATCEVRNINTGLVVATGIALCSNAEKTKRYFDEYAILSMAQTRAIGKAYRNLLAWLMKAAGFEATPAEEMDFAVEEPKKPSKPVVEVVAEIVEEEEVDKDKLMFEIAKCTKIKQLTDLYFTHKQLFDSNETLMTVLKAKKDNLTKK